MNVFDCVVNVFDCVVNVFDYQFKKYDGKVLNCSENSKRLDIIPAKCGWFESEYN